MKKSIFLKFFGKEIKSSQIRHICDNSKKITPNSIFFARQGVNGHGNDFVDHKVANTARAILSSKKQKVHAKNFYYIKNLEIKLLGFLYEYWNVSINTKFFGITGTNGKTTTAFILYQLLKSQGKNVIYIGTIGAIINSRWHKVINTTPGLFDLFELLGKQKNKEDLYVVLEVSSHALAQNRLGHLKFQESLITNITSDHKDFHKTQVNYELAKLKILSATKNKVFFAGNSYKKLSTRIPITKIKSIVTINQATRASTKSSIRFSLQKSNILFKLGNQNHCIIKSPFNDKLNTLNFIAAASLFSVITDASLNGIKISNIKLPKGRFELIPYKNKKTIIVDFAHDHHSIYKILQATEQQYQHKIIVFGCGGNRDKTKRPKMMKAALKFADEIIFTSDNSRNESFESISRDALSGKSNSKVTLIEERGEAIKHGIAKIQKNGALYVLGRGHEETLEIAGKVIRFNDSKFIKESI